jgi:hypothetical protein
MVGNKGQTACQSCCRPEIRRSLQVADPEGRLQFSVSTIFVIVCPHIPSEVKRCECHIRIG